MRAGQDPSRSRLAGSIPAPADRLVIAQGPVGKKHDMVTCRQTSDNLCLALILVADFDARQLCPPTFDPKHRPVSLNPEKG